MSSSARPTEVVCVAPLLQDSQTVHLVSKATRRRSAEPVEVRGHAFWPLAYYRAEASGQDRRPWSEQVKGAVDLVSSRTGYIPEELDFVRVPVGRHHLIPPRVRYDVANQLWYEFFRDKIHRRQRPRRAPVLQTEPPQLIHVPHAIAASGETLFLVDPVTQHAEELSNFPWVRQQLNLSG